MGRDWYFVPTLAHKRIRLERWSGRAKGGGGGGRGETSVPVSD